MHEESSRTERPSLLALARSFATHYEENERPRFYFD